MENIPAVAGNKAVVINAEFIKLKIFNDVTDPSNVSIYTFSSSYKSETIDGQVYSPMGGLLAVGIQQRDIRVTSADTSRHRINDLRNRIIDYFYKYIEIDEFGCIIYEFKYESCYKYEWRY